MANNYTPSKLRKMGREDFRNDLNPKDCHPFKENTFNFQSYFSNYKDGWYQAKADYYLEVEEEIDPKDLRIAKLEAALKDVIGTFESLEADDLKLILEKENT